MSRIPANEALELLQGSDLDETWEFFEDDEQTEPTSFTGTVATLRIAKDSESTPLILLTSAGPPASPPAADGLYFVDNTLRIFIRAVTLAGLGEEDFDRSECGEAGGRVYIGLNTLTFVKAGFTERVNQGEAHFSPFVETA